MISIATFYASSVLYMHVCVCVFVCVCTEELDPHSSAELRFKVEVSETLLRCVKLKYDQANAIIELQGLKVRSVYTYTHTHKKKRHTHTDACTHAHAHTHTCGVVPAYCLHMRPTRMHLGP